MTLPLKLFSAATAAGLAAACAMPLGAATGGAEGPVACALTVTERGGMVTVEGVVEARSAVSGAYDLALRQSSFGGSSDIRQGGDFTLAAGAVESLGSASFSGTAAGIDGTLTVTVDGQSYRCPLTR